MTPADFKTIRLSLKLTSKKLAEKIGKSVSTVYRYEQGKIKIPLLVSDHLIRLKFIHRIGL